MKARRSASSWAYRLAVAIVIGLGIFTAAYSEAAIQVDSTQYYTVEQRGEAGQKNVFAWDNAGGTDRQLVMNRIIYKRPNYDVRFKFMGPDAEGHYQIASELSGGGALLTARAPGAVGDALYLDGSPDDDEDEDDALWRLEDLGDGYVRFLSKSTGLAISFDDDTDPSPDHTDSVARLADPNPNDVDDSSVSSLRRTEWRLGLSHITPPDKSLGVNQNGWAPSQTKISVLTRKDLYSSPSGSVTSPPDTDIAFAVTKLGPQSAGQSAGAGAVHVALSGTMSYWGEKWGLHFYRANLTSLNEVGHYSISADGITQKFAVVPDPFRNVRADRGGAVAWRDIVDGILKSQEAPVQPDGDHLQEATKHEGIPDFLGTYYTLDGGYYDASSVDNKIYRTAQIYRSLAIGYAETTTASASSEEDAGETTGKRSEILGTLRDGVDWLGRTQQPDGSWHLGKVRISGDAYYWSTDKDPGGVSQVIIALATTAKALLDDDAFYSAKALFMAEDAWTWVMANSADDADFYEPSGGYFGSQSTVISAAIELHLAGGSNYDYRTYADSRILEAEYRWQNGIYRSTGPTPWPGTATKRDFYIGIHLSRYHPHADTNTSVKDAIEAQLNNIVKYYVDTAGHQTPWNIPEGLGAVRVWQGWFRSMASYAHAMIEIARVLNTQKSLDAALAAWDAIAGNNPYASNCFVGGRGEANIPLWHQQWDEMTGAVVPGPMALYEAAPSLDATLTNEGAGYQHTEQVVMTSLPVVPFWAIANKLVAPLDGNQAPEFYAPSFALRDAGALGDEYASSLADSAFDSDGDPVTFAKVDGPAWIGVSSGGAISGTPYLSDVGVNAFSVEVSDGDRTARATVTIDVIDPGPVNLMEFDVAEDTYSRSPSADTPTGTQTKIELRTQVGADTYSRFGYLKFDVSGIRTKVVGVRLYIHSIDESDDIDVFDVSSDWSESTLTWNNQPDAGPLLATVSPTIGEFSYADISGYVDGDGVYSVLLKETGGTFNRIGTKEGGLGAYLEVSTLQDLSASPSSAPTGAPTRSPTNAPTSAPTANPSSSPSEVPTDTPTMSPSEVPTGTPTMSPSLSGPKEVLTFNVAEDTYSRSPSADTPTGTQTKIELRTQGGADTYSRFGYLKFNVAGIQTAIVSVKLYIYSIDEPDDIDVFSVPSDWSETALTWNNQPDAGSLIATASPIVGEYSPVDISDYIDGDGTYSVLLKETGGTFNCIGTREGGKGAYLEITTLLDILALPLLTFDVAEDTHSRSPSPDTPMGAQPKMELRTQATNVYSRFGFVKFNVAGITTAVASVKLYLFSIDESDGIDVYSVSSDWNESTLTWNNQPNAGSLVATASPIVGEYASVDLTGYIESDGTYSFMLKETGDSYNKIGTKEGGNGAYLEIRTLPENSETS